MTRPPGLPWPAFRAVLRVRSAWIRAWDGQWMYAWRSLYGEFLYHGGCPDAVEATRKFRPCLEQTARRREQEGWT